jgi:hypothetical protein
MWLSADSPYQYPTSTFLKIIHYLKLTTLNRKLSICEGKKETIRKASHGRRRHWKGNKE